MHTKKAETWIWWGWRRERDGEWLMPVEGAWREQITKEPWSMMKAILAAAQRDAMLEDAVVRAFGEVVECLDEASLRREPQWWSVIAELFSSPCVERGLRWMRKTQLLPFVFPLPSTSAGWDLDQASNAYHHETVWEHTLSVIRCLQDLFVEIEASAITRLRLVLLAYFHDVGKTIPESGHQYKADGGIRFVGHPMVSTDIARHNLTRLGVADVLRHDIQRLVLLHDAVLDIREADLLAEPVSPKLLGLLRKLERRREMITDLAIFAIADRKAHAPGHNDDRLMRLFYACVERDFAIWDQRLEPLLAPHEIAAFLPTPYENAEPTGAGDAPPPDLAVAEHTQHPNQAVDGDAQHPDQSVDGDAQHLDLAVAERVQHPDHTSGSLALLQEHLLWAQQYAFLHTHEEALEHLRRLQHLATCAHTTLSDPSWLGALLTPMQKAWPALTQPIAFWVIDHMHRLRFPHPDPKEARLLFPHLLHGHAIRSLATQIAAEKGCPEPPQGRWIGSILRQVGSWQIEHGQRDPELALQHARFVLLQRWDHLFASEEESIVLK